MRPQDFVKEYNRMCGKYNHQGSDDDCSRDCPMYDNGCWQGTVLDTRHPEKFTETYNIVAEWSDAHPAETRQDRFLKLFPRAKIDSDTGVLNFCPNSLDYNAVSELDCKYSGCLRCEKEYWLAPADESEN